MSNTSVPAAAGGMPKISRRAFLRAGTVVAAVALPTLAVAAVPEDEAHRLAALIERHRAANAAARASVDRGNDLADEFEEREADNPTPYETSAGTLLHPNEECKAGPAGYLPTAVVDAYVSARDKAYEWFGQVDQASTKEELARNRELTRVELERIERLYQADIAAYAQARDAHEARRAAFGVDAADKASDVLIDIERSIWRELIAFPCTCPRTGRMKVDYLRTAWIFEGQKERYGAFCTEGGLDDLINSLCGGPAK